MRLLPSAALSNAALSNAALSMSVPVNVRPCHCPVTVRPCHCPVLSLSVPVTVRPCPSLSVLVGPARALVGPARAFCWSRKSRVLVPQEPCLVPWKEVKWVPTCIEGGVEGPWLVTGQCL